MTDRKRARAPSTLPPPRRCTVMPKRVRYRVVPHRSKWKVFVGRRLLSTRAKKSDAVWIARKAAKHARAEGKLTQLVVHNRDGKIARQ